MPEDKILEVIRRMAKDIDCSKIDKIEIRFLEGGGIDTTIETTENLEDVAIKEICSWDEQDIPIKTLKMALMSTTFRDDLQTFLKGVDALVTDKDIWYDALNELFEDIARFNKRDYQIKVIKS